MFYVDFVFYFLQIGHATVMPTTGQTLKFNKTKEFNNQDFALTSLMLLYN